MTSSDSGHLQPVPSGSPEGAPGGQDLAGLIDRAARGDEGGFAALYDATRARCYGLALRVLRDPAQADEVTQEAYLEAWRCSARFDPARGSPLAWLMTLVHRKAVDRVRTAEASSRRETAYQQQERTVDPDTTAESAQASLDAGRVRRALSSLTDVQREAIELAYFGGYTHTEVATMLDLPLGTAKTRIRDALIRLRDSLGVSHD